MIQIFLSLVFLYLSMVKELQQCVNIITYMVILIYLMTHQYSDNLK